MTKLFARRNGSNYDCFFLFGDREVALGTFVDCERGYVFRASADAAQIGEHVNASLDDATSIHDHLAVLRRCYDEGEARMMEEEEACYRAAHARGEVD